MERFENLLPIGSVVLPKNSDKKLMITGRLQKQIETNKIWEYCACLYPEGQMNPNNNILFNHEQIERVYFIGYQDQEEFAHKAKVTEAIDRGEII